MSDPLLDSQVDLWGDARSVEGYRKADKVFNFKHLQGSTEPLKSNQGGSQMSEQIKGVIAEKKVEGNRYAFKVNGKWMSCFINNDTPPEAEQLLKDLAPGDGATFSTYTNKGYLNIDGVVEYTKGDPSKVPQDKPKGTSFSGGNKFQGKGGGGYKPEDKRPGLVTMTFSYAKDQVCEILKGADMSNQSPEAMLKFAEEQTPRLAKVYLAYAIGEAKALGWSPEPKV